MAHLCCRLSRWATADILDEDLDRFELSVLFCITVLVPFREELHHFFKVLLLFLFLIAEVEAGLAC